MGELLETIAAVVGPVGVVADPDGYVVDWLGKATGPSLMVVRPGSAEELAAVVGHCADHDVAIVPQGGNSGLCGGSVPLGADHPEQRPCVVVSLERMNEIVSIDPERATATVQAGVTIQALQEACAAEGLLFAPDWGARGTAHVGGGIATNAGGLNVLRWGSMREQVLGLEVVLADGRIWDGLRSLRKDATGIDLKQLFIGSEGTLGIVTAAVFKLHPLPSVHQTAFVSLRDIDALLPLFALARAHGRGLISAFELVPEEGVRRVLDKVPAARRPLEAIGEWYVLLRLSGGDDVADAVGEVLGAAAEADLIDDAVVAVTAEQTENLWFLRDEIPAPTTFDALGNRHKFDLAVPVDRVTEFVHAAGPLVDGLVSGTCTYAFGHVGDGNLHFNIYPGPECSVEAFTEHGAALERAIDELTWSFGGTISAEHGVGQSMRARLRDQKSDLELELMSRVKTALDPDGLMNPGKLYPSGT